jgi:polyisoprenoid-binding protein YceI
MKKLSLLAAVLGLVACGTVPDAPEGITPTRDADTAAPSWPPGRAYRVDPDASMLRFVVYPAGPLARIGHPHVIGGGDIDGRVVIAEPFERSRLALRVDVAALEVDRPEWRAREGFEAERPADSIAATRQNMLGPGQLDADRHPAIRIESLSITGPRWQPDVTARIELAGTARELTVPVALEIGEAALTATGRFVIRQSDFGIEPFSAAGGNLRVADEVLVRFRIRAEADARQPEVSR